MIVVVAGIATVLISPIDPAIPGVLGPDVKHEQELNQCSPSHHLNPYAVVVVIAAAPNQRVAVDYQSIVAAAAILDASAKSVHQSHPDLDEPLINPAESRRPKRL
jgi:hypothetical protein